MTGERFSIHDTVWSTTTTRRFWEYEVTQTQHSFGAKYGRRIAAFARRRIGPPPGRIVDLGAGPGFLTQALLQAGFDVAATDETDAGRQLCAGRNERFAGFLGAVALADVHDLGPFDAAVAVEVVEHLPEPDLVRFLTLLVDLLKPGGRCLVTCPNGENLADKAVLCPECGARFHRWQHVRSVDTTEMARYLSHPGLVPTAVVATDWSSRVPARLRGRGILGPRGRRAPHLVGVARRRWT